MTLTRYTKLFGVNEQLSIEKFSRLLLNNDPSNLPSNESRPHAIQTMKLMPTEPVRSNSPEGETNIPDPEINYSIVAHIQVVLAPESRISIFW